MISENSRQRMADGACRRVTVLAGLLFVLAGSGVVACQPAHAEAGEAAASRDGGRHFFASPDGTGNGREEPFRIADFWKVARPGDTLHLLAGRYTGDDSMITPPQGLAGTEDARIWIRAAEDGAVQIDGEFQRRPVRLYGNDYFGIEGINAHSSSDDVVELERSNHNVVRRVCGWDAADGNTNVFAVHRSENNLLEDCAGWGIARKIFSTSQGGNNNVFRRCWGRWEGCHSIGPKMVFATAYNSYGNVFENCIGTWNALKMREIYELEGYDGKPWRGNGAGVYENHQVNQPYGIFAVDRQDGKKKTDTVLLGCIAYVLADQRADWSGHGGVNTAIWSQGVSNYGYKDCLSYVESDARPWGLYVTVRNRRLIGGEKLYAVNISNIGPRSGKLYENELAEKLWTVRDVYTARNGREMVRENGSLLRPLRGKGAELRYRYHDLKLTDKRLWPWPMDERIIEAMKQGGYEDPVDVTETIMRLGRDD